MSIFSNPDEGNIHRCGTQRLARTTNGFNWITLAVEKMVMSNSSPLYNTFPKVGAKAGGMRSGKADVFVEMEHFNSFPINAWQGGQGLEKFELGRTGGCDDARFS